MQRRTDPKQWRPSSALGAKLAPLIAAALLTFATSGLAGECTCCDVPSNCETPQLFGDWLGVRPLLVDNGVTVWADNTSFLIGNATGGVQQDLDFGGHGDYVLNFDCGKLGIQEGMFVKVRAEHRFGETITSDVGCFISPTLIADLPIFGSEQVYITNVLITQMLGDSLAVFAGKMDTLDGDMNAFAHGRGKTQFSNMAFVFNPIVGATVPYSTLGAGFAVLRDNESIFIFSVLNSTDTTNTSGFEQLFNDGLLLSASLRLPTRFGGLPGHQLLGGTWNNQTYRSISEAYIEYPDVAIPPTRGSWCLYWNFDQYLVVDADEPLRGWGPFGRAGIADDNTSPLAWFLSFGIGGNVPAPSRPDDTFGIGWYYGGMSSQIGPLITSQFGPIGNGQGIECFYNYQWTPAIRLTPDLQFLVPALKNVDPSLILGVRAQLIF
jgi:porin